MKVKMTIENIVAIILAVLVVVIAFALTITSSAAWNWWSFAGLTLMTVGALIWKLLGKKSE